ncbi:MAG: hypothetical protein QGH74_06340 [Candidatus Brocadiia bacterium]|jgi:hypothetical protein|nr:hypothetical protein [Candidatus Brocadiia bacterium]
MRKVFIAAAALLAGLLSAGCPMSRNIVDLQPRQGQPRLEQLERNLNYADPDAGRPDYVRVRTR